MKRVLQTRQGAPHGNCHMACLASVFELSLDQVPDHLWPDDVPWQESQDGPQQTARGRRVRDDRYELFQAWLADRGSMSIGVPVTPGSWIPKGYALGSVVNPRGIPHYVVCLDGRIVWDPNPAQDSYDREVTMLEYFVALDPAKLLADSVERQLLKRCVIGWDADQDDEFRDALGAARDLLGLQLASDAEDVLERLQQQHDDDAEFDQ